jgi:chromosome segregation ATPase
MSMIGPVAGGAARAAGKAAAKAAPVVKKTVQTLEQQIDELEKRLVVGRQKFKEATDPAARKKIADFGISLKKRLDGLKDELTAKTTSEGQVLRSGRINNRSQSTIESKGVTGKKQNKSANKPKTLGDTRDELESEFNRISRQLAVLLKQKPQTPAQKEKISQAIERLSDEKMAIIKQRRLLIQRANEIKKKMAKDSISKGKK